MAQRLTVLLVGRSGKRLTVLEDMLLGDTGLATARRLVATDATASLAELNALPDVVLVDLARGGESLLEGLFDGVEAAYRPPMVVIGSDGDTDVMRRSMRAGARDFHADSVSEEELTASIRRVGMESQLAQRATRGTLTAVINGKGGSGSSFLAAALATVPLLSWRHDGQRTAIIDLDTDFGDIPVYFDMSSDDSLLQALSIAGDLDAVALEGFLRKHASGVHILAGRNEQLRARTTPDVSAVTRLLNLACRLHEHVVLDLPRHLDEATIAALELADHVIVVTQQTVPHVRDTRFVIGLLQDIGLANQSIAVAINRFDPRGAVRRDDLDEVFEDFAMFTIPNDYKRVSSSINNGTPLLERFPKSPAAKAIVGMAEKLWPEPVTDAATRKRSFFSRG